MVAVLQPGKSLIIRHSRQYYGTMYNMAREDYTSIRIVAVQAVIGLRNIVALTLHEALLLSSFALIEWL